MDACADGRDEAPYLIEGLDSTELLLSGAITEERYSHYVKKT